MRTLSRIGIVALAVVALALATTGVQGGGSAEAAPNTISSAVGFEGSTGSVDNGGFFAYCDECTPDLLFDCGGCAIALGLDVDFENSVEWTFAAAIDTEYDTDKLRQGFEVDLEDTLTPLPGAITINYDIPYTVGLFGLGGNFPANWAPSSETASGTLHFQFSTLCTPPLVGMPDALCAVTDTIDLLDSPEFLGFSVQTDLIINHEFTVSAAGITSHRVVSVNGVPDADITWGYQSPSTIADPFTIPCGTPIGTDVHYALGGLEYAPSSVAVTGSADIGVTFVIPVLDDVSKSYPIISGTVIDAPLTMDGSPTPSFILGQVQIDNEAPEIAAVIQGGTFTEGSNVSFSAVANDNCPTLTHEWAFSDGGVAFNSPASHTFDDNSTEYTGLLEVTDLAGNSTLWDFDVNDIANADPGVIGPTTATAPWGAPISFHADAVDPGAADQPTLTFSWDFGDGTSALGSDVTHPFAAPGVYDVEVSVTDKDGGVGTASLTSTVTRRATTLVYSGPVQGLPNKYTTLSASLSDELGKPVVGRTVTFTLGTQTISAVTNSAGIASVALKLSQKPGMYTVSADFIGDSLYFADDTGTTPYKIGK
jgi:hypothetical protein